MVDDVDNVGDLNDRVRGYQSWVESTLIPTLQGYQRRKRELDDQIGHYEDLKRQLAVIAQRRETGPLKTRLDLGADCFIQAEVPDPGRVFVHVALGFHAEFTTDEAMAFADKKKQSLLRCMEGVQALAAETERDVATALVVIKQLQSLGEGSTVGP